MSIRVLVPSVDFNVHEWIRLVLVMPEKMIVATLDDMVSGSDTSGENTCSHVISCG